MHDFIHRKAEILFVHVASSCVQFERLAVNQTPWKEAPLRLNVSTRRFKGENKRVVSSRTRSSNILIGFQG